MSREQEEALHQKIAELYGRGDADIEAGDPDAAIEKYEAALELIPRPIERWNSSTQILTALGDAYYLKKDWRQARSALDEATRCPRGLGNPFIHLRLGQIELELGNKDRARDELGRAYLGAGEEIFAGEDPRFLALAKEGAEGRTAQVGGAGQGGEEPR